MKQKRRLAKRFAYSLRRLLRSITWDVHRCCKAVIKKQSPLSGRSNELRGNYADIGMAQLSLAQGNYDQAIVYLQNDEGRDSAISLYWLGAAYAGKGDQEKALATLQKSFDEGFRDFAAIDAAPYFSSLRAEPRFQQMIRKYHK